MIQHTQDCDDLMTGRALRSIIDQELTAAGRAAIRSVTLPQLTARRDAMRAFEADGRCDCAKLALGRVTADLALIRKQIRARVGFGKDWADLAPQESALLAERDDLRAFITAQALTA